jgi:ankyrin repeat protein
MRQFQTKQLKDPNFAIHIATCDGDIVKLNKLLGANEHDLEQQIYGHGTPLNVAIANNHLEIVRILLSASADSDSSVPDDYGEPIDTALTLAT